jgi:protein-tyrosine phosphatase
VSRLLVCQHHLADLLAGAALGLICLTVIRDDRQKRPFVRNLRVGGYYTAAAMATLVICVWLGRASWPLWWPALSLSMAAMAYLFLGPRLFVKQDGRLGRATRWMLWPTLLGQRASLHWYSRTCRPHDAVTDRLWIGRKLSNAAAAEAVAAGVGAVIDLTCEFDESSAFRSCHYLHLPTLDLTSPAAEQIDSAVEFIRRHESQAIVYVHCKVGYSRTAAVAAAYLLATGRADSVADAIGSLRRSRPSILIRPEARNAIAEFHRRMVGRPQASLANICTGVPASAGHVPR